MNTEYRYDTWWMLDVSCHKTAHNAMKTVYTMSMEAILAVMNISILSSSENEAWNTVSLYGILTHDLYDTGVALYQLN